MRMMDSQRIRNAFAVGGAWLLGVPKFVKVLSPHELECVSSACGVTNPVIMEYTRFTLADRVYHSQMYTRLVKSNTSVIITHSKQFYITRRILYIWRATISKCCLVCTNIVLTDTGINFPPHIKEYFASPTSTTTIVPLSVLADTALYIELSFEQREYVCTLPNALESD